jgi:hypothetical protein
VTSFSLPSFRTPFDENIIPLDTHKHNAPQVAMQGPTIRDQPQELIIYLVYQMILSRI